MPQRIVHLAQGPREEMALPRVEALKNALLQSRFTYLVDPLSERELLCIFRLEDRMSTSDRELLSVLLSDSFETSEVVGTIKNGFQSRLLLPAQGGYHWARIPIASDSQLDGLANYLRKEPRIGHTLVTKDRLYSKIYVPTGITLDEVMRNFWEILGYDSRVRFDPFIVYGKGKEQTLPRINGYKLHV